MLAGLSMLSTRLRIKKKMRVDKSREATDQKSGKTVTSQKPGMFVQSWQESSGLGIDHSNFQASI